ncbi:hypothetical protein WG906_06770 [Pedobacter sp. P351]|uniref:hypothetical protein n=1 Tax=Pedobacter superstes TaxID=3133441 RepID=UPI0030987399
MEELKVISGNTPDEVWQNIGKDLEVDPNLIEYSVIIEHLGHSVTFDIDIDLGGGFEGGYTLTRFTSNLKRFDDFRFNLHRQDFVDSIGKLFGMEDILIGYPDFDKEIVVKSNDEERIKDILSLSEVRETIQTLPDFNFHIGHHNSSNTEVESAFLELRIDDGITDPEKLRPIYNAFLMVLDKVDLDSNPNTKYM